MSVAHSSAYTRREYRWVDWKAMYAVKGLPLQYEDEDSMYTIWTYDASEVHVCQIWKGSVPESVSGIYTQVQNDLDKTDFETNFKSIGNGTLGQIDPDGAQIVRIKAAKRGWSYMAIPVEFKTAEIGSLYAKLVDGTNRPGVTLKFFDSNDVEITEEGLAEVNEEAVIKTVIDFEPSYDYEVIGGNLRIEQDISNAQDCRLWIIAVPDIPAEYGGSKEMAGGVNLRFLAPQNSFEVDGRVSKSLKYDAVYHTNKLRFIFKHTAGLKVWIHLTLELYKL
jgi:hypothetical protein